MADHWLESAYKHRYVVNYYLFSAGSAVMGHIGNARCRMFDMRKGVDFAREWLEKNRFSIKL